MFSIRSYALMLTLAVLPFAPVFAGDPQLATVRVVTPHSMTTGTVIHQSAEHGTFILTCKHGYRGSESFHFEVGGRRLTGENRIASVHGDLALMWRRGTGTTAGISPIAQQDVGEGARCTSIGHDQKAGAKFSQLGSSTPTSWTSPVHRISSITRGQGEGVGRPITMSIETATERRGGPGRSGGGLFDAAGDLVGVCSQDRLEGCVFVSHSTIIRFLNRCHAKGLISWWSPREAFDDRAVNDLVDFHLGWAKNFRLEERYQEAIESYKAALDLDPGSDEGRLGRALVYRHVGNRKLALEELRKIDAAKYSQAVNVELEYWKTASSNLGDAGLVGN